MNVPLRQLSATFLWLIVFVAVTPNGAPWCAKVTASMSSDVPQIEMTQSANIRILFLGVPSEYIDESSFLSRIAQNVSQFAYPNNITWNLNVSIVSYDFPVDVMSSLIDNAYHLEGITYYNVTLLDDLLSKLEYSTVPERGYLIVFMWIPDGGVSHSWFYVQERPDLFLGRTDFFDGNPSRYWRFPPYFGGMRRALYFDLSDVIERTPTKTMDTAIRLFNNGLVDMFVNLLGSSDSRMIAADMQKYENYVVKILWLNGTGDQLPLEQIEKAFKDLMPWTEWNITVQTSSIDVDLNALIENRTVELSKPLNYSFLLANGSEFSILASRNVIWDVWKDSGEYDPISQYLFERVKDYFNLTSLEDKSIIPVIILQLRNDRAIGGVAGIGPSISWFPHNIIILGCQGGTVTAMGESGPILLTHQLRHEIGHWVSLSHHSARFELGYPKVICSMRAITDRFCAFCKDARARMSFISYYQAITELFSNSSNLLTKMEDQESLKLIKSRLNNSLQLFYNWAYVESIEDVIQAYHQLEDIINEAPNESFINAYFIPIMMTATAILLISTIILIRIKMRKKLKQLRKGNVAKGMI